MTEKANDDKNKQKVNTFSESSRQTRAIKLLALQNFCGSNAVLGVTDRAGDVVPSSCARPILGGCLTHSILRIAENKLLIGWQGLWTRRPRFFK